MISKIGVLFNHNPIESLTKALDLIRIFFFKRTLKINLLRKIYITSHLRLGSIFILASLFYLPIALTRPGILLVLGPLVYGYFHLIASYYFTQPLAKSQENENSSNKKFTVFCAFTLFIVVFNYFFYNTALTKDLPKDFFEIIIATVLSLIVIYKSKILRLRIMLVILLTNFGLLSYAWHEPLIFVSTTLLVHNWIAFFYWIFISKNKENLVTALTATAIFGIIHFLVLLGHMDSFIDIQSQLSIFGTNVSGTSWLLAPWSLNPIVGQRSLVLYTFGLAIHYFIWLKAIPENRQIRETPNSYQEGYKILKKNIGKHIAIFVVGLSLISTTLWMLDTSGGAEIYFAIATLHAWLELNFLISRLLTRNSV